MKKYIVLLALACVALLVVSSVAPAFAARGAVKTPLISVATSEPAGQVIVTPTGANKIEVTVQVRDSSVTSAKSCTLYAGIVAPWGTSPFRINAKGNGSGHVSYNIPAGYTGEVFVQVSIWEPDTSGPKRYYATLWVTLK